MKFNCGDSPQQKHGRLIEWHKWFAWYSVRVASHDCRWLEVVQRKGTPSWEKQKYLWRYKV